MKGAINNINDFRKMKEAGEKISMLTCYDYTFARLLDQSCVDTLLIGDSLGNVYAGYENTLPVEVDDIIYHSRAVRRGAPDKFIIADLPYLSYQVSDEEAVRNAGLIIKQSNVDAVKLEGGIEFCSTVRALVRASIPVVGHLGLVPQSVHKFGGYFVQGRGEEASAKLLNDALELEKAGAFALVLEKVPEELAQRVTKELSIPVIGIGAGRYCDGQVLVITDLLGLDESFNPKFLKKYANLSETTINAVNGYSDEVKKGVFPGPENVFKG